jgi:WD40 repeat protein
MVNEQAGVLRTFSPVESLECPTQMATSGDDRLLKVWDCSGALGMDNPLAGGWNTFSPFCMLPPENDDVYSEEWKEYYAQRANYPVTVSGTTRRLKTLATGHKGNVFHLTPLKYDPGKFLTCAADGYLRLLDTVADRSTVVRHPHLFETDIRIGFLRAHAFMAYSHVMLTSNTGLICSERGLHRFDLRLSPRQQQKRSLLKDLIENEPSWRSPCCKACAVWNPHDDSHGDTESSYVFAGGASEAVGLYDLRMDASKGRIIQRYRPKGFATRNTIVSVSGLDITKGKGSPQTDFMSGPLFRMANRYSLHLCQQIPVSC